jgi:WD40 repeat protein
MLQAPPDPAQAHVAKTFAHTSPWVSCRFDPKGRYIFAGAEDNRVWRYTLADGAKTELAGHESWVRAIAFHPEGDTLITGGYEGRLLWWPASAEKPAPTRTVNAHNGWVRAVAVSPDGSLAASCGNDKLVKLWKLEDGSLIKELPGHESHVYNVAFHPGGKALVSGDLKGNLFHWDLTNHTLARKFAAAAVYKYDETFRADIGGVRGIAFSKDGKTLACSGITAVSNAFAGIGNPAFIEFDWEAGKETITHLSKAKLQGVGWGVALHPAGFTVGISGGGAGGHLLFFKPGEANEFHTLNLGNTARDLDLHPDGLQLVTAHFDKNLRLVKLGPKG